MFDFLGHHPIRVKLSASFFLVILVLFSTALFMTFSLERFDHDFDTMEVIDHQRRDLFALHQAQRQATAKVRLMALQPANSKRLGIEYQQAVSEFDSQYQKVVQQVTTNEGRAFFANIKDIAAQLRQSEQGIVDAVLGTEAVGEGALVLDTSYEQQLDELSSQVHFERERLLNVNRTILTNLHLKTGTLQFVLLVMLCIAAILSSLIMFVLYGAIIRPLQTLTVASQSFAKGNVDVRVPVVGDDEVGLLGKTFNNLVMSVKRSYGDLERQVQERTQELEQAKIDLERQVQERTQELEQAKSGLQEEVARRTQELERKVTELESFNKIAIGREQKMIELKEELTQLKAQRGQPDERS